jgi:hypothetical protein
MSLHPDERPQDIEGFRQALMGNWTPPIRPTGKPNPPSLKMILAGDQERTLLWVAAGLIVFSLIITLAR